MFTNAEDVEAPRAVFHICKSKSKFVEVNKITENQSDVGMVVTTRLHLEVKSLELSSDGIYII